MEFNIVQHRKELAFLRLIALGTIIYGNVFTRVVAVHPL